MQPINGFVQVEAIEVEKKSLIITAHEDIPSRYKLLAVPPNEQGLKVSMEVLLDGRFVQQIDKYFFTKLDNIYAIVE